LVPKKFGKRGKTEKPNFTPFLQTLLIREVRLNRHLLSHLCVGVFRFIQGHLFNGADDVLKLSSQSIFWHQKNSRLIDFFFKIPFDRGKDDREKSPRFILFNKINLGRIENYIHKANQIKIPIFNNWRDFTQYCWSGKKLVSLTFRIIKEWADLWFVPKAGEAKTKLIVSEKN